jgi:hypothetical protein
VLPLRDQNLLLEEVFALQQESESIHQSSFHGQLDFYNRLQAIMLEIGCDKDGYGVISPERRRQYEPSVPNSVHRIADSLFNRIVHILSNRDESQFLGKTDLNFYDSQAAFEAMRAEIAIRFERTHFADFSQNEIEEKLEYSFDFIYRKVQELAAALDERDSGHSAFSHFYEVARIALEELPGASLDVILAALGHDLLEDLGKKQLITIEDIRAIFGGKVANMILALSKHPLEHYLTSEEKTEFALLKENERNAFIGKRQARLKALRAEDYFGKLDTYDDETLIVKCADRIANLRTLDDCDRTKQINICEQTIRYFLPVIVKRNPVAFVLMMDELRGLNSKYSLKLDFQIGLFETPYSRVRDDLLRKTSIRFEDKNGADEEVRHMSRSRAVLPLENPYRVSEILAERNFRKTEMALSAFDKAVKVS